MAETRELARYLDDPVHFLIWQVDEVAPIMMGLFIGLLAGSPILFTLIGMIFTYFYKTFRDSQADGFVLHFLYWHGFIGGKSRTTPNAFVKKYLP